MKRVFAALLHFFGGLTLALFLIALTVVFVIAGTFIESKTDSHLFAARITYHNPLFLFLLVLYFVNILCSALRRIPFQRKHAPFLLTHLGLLMVIAGTFLKNLYGVQGIMPLSEGTGAHHILLPESFALHLETPQGHHLVSLKPKQVGPLTSPLPSFEWAILDWVPHSAEKLQGWIKNDRAEIAPFPPFPLIELGSDLPTLLPLSKVATVAGTLWCLQAFRTSEIEEVLKRAFLQETELDRMPLSALPCGFRIAFSITDGLKEAILEIDENKFNLLEENAPLKCVPTLLVIQDLEGNEALFAINEKGKISAECFRANVPHSLLVFDKGYGGYAVYFKADAQELFAELKHSFEILPPSLKPEEHLPSLRLYVSDGKQREVLPLTYDRMATGLKWPILGGKYLVRFQSHRQEIPYHIRLRKAQKISYPNSTQPYSYESDLLITERAHPQRQIETTLRMNRVFETREGYRFYLSSISDGLAKKIQIVVNRDPAKYWLTYPGGALVACGILLLFWLKSYRPRR